MFIGLSLLIVSLQRQGHEPEGYAIHHMDQDATREYWMQLTKMMVPPNEVIIPDSPTYKALQWMVLRDPARPLKEETRLLQRYILSFLYFSWSGPSWTLTEGSGWLGQEGLNNLFVHECTWFGVQCNQEDEVIALEMDSELFTASGGTIPTQIGHLTALQTLALVGHRLKGTIPTEMARLTNLMILDLSSNQLTTGNFEFLPLQKLEVLSLPYNQINDTVDFATLKEARKLRVLELNDNIDMTGDLLSNLANWTDLEHVDLSTTSFDGTLSSDVEKLTNLRYLSLGSKFSSTIPTTIGRCTNLDTFSVEIPAVFLGRGFQGGLPTEIGLLTNLKTLRIFNNYQLGSTLPTEVGLATSLVQLEVVKSGLQGTLPTELGNLQQLTGLFLTSNPFTGTVPVELGRLTNLYEMDIRDTNIVGSMPEEVCTNRISDVKADCRSILPSKLGADDSVFACDCCSNCA